MFVTTRADVPLSFSITSSAREAGAGFALGSTGTAGVVAGVVAGVDAAVGAGLAGAATGATDLLAAECGECSLGE
jgi:hypothetical protein